LRQAAIFDMDGVLVNSEPETLKQRQGYFDSLGLHVTEAQSTAMLGGNLADIWPQLLPGRPKSDYAQLQAGYVTYKHTHPFDYQAILLPTVVETFDWLKGHDFKVAIASASDREFIDLMLQQTGLARDVDVITSGRDFAESKPNPAVYNAALKALQLAPEQAIAVEDSTVGIKAAKAAGLYTFAVPIHDTRFSADQSLADQRINQVADIEPFLLAD